MAIICQFINKIVPANRSSASLSPDILRLSDKQAGIVRVDVRYFGIIGQAGQYSLRGCPIL